VEPELKHWRGTYETFEEVDAATEEEAIKKLAEKIAAILKSGDHSIICWEVNPR